MMEMMTVEEIRTVMDAVSDMMDQEEKVMSLASCVAGVNVPPMTGEEMQSLNNAARIIRETLLDESDNEPRRIVWRFLRNLTKTFHESPEEVSPSEARLMENYSRGLLTECETVQHFCHIWIDRSIRNQYPAATGATTNLRPIMATYGIKGE
jgi:hypothetical protein